MRLALSLVFWGACSAVLASVARSLMSAAMWCASKGLRAMHQAEPAPVIVPAPAPYVPPTVNDARCSSVRQ